MTLKESDNRRRTGRQERRERIVDAALRAFSRYGYRGATTRQLARLAGITEVTLFRHFPTKEKLFGAVIEKYSILPVLWSELVAQGETVNARAGLRRIGRRVMEILRERRDLIRLMFSEAVTNPRTARMLFRQGPGRIIEDGEKLLAALQKRGEIRRVDLRVASRAVLGIFFSFMLLQEILFGQESGRMDVRKAADALSDILWRGLRPERSQRKGGRGA